MSRALGLSSSEWLFFGLLFAGNALLSDIPTALLLTALLFIFCLILRPWQRWLGIAAGERIDRVVVNSLLGLGIFPFFWLASVLILGQRYPYPLFLPLLPALAFSLLKKTENKNTGSSFMPLFVLFLATFLVMVFPYSRIGAKTDDAFAFRAYFSSDYLKHYSVVEVLNRAHLPPVNPYFSGESLHYYWLSYTFPAAISRVTGSTEHALFAWSFTLNVLFLLLLWRLLRSLYTRGRWLPVGLALLGLFSSLEGLYFFMTRAGWSHTAFFQAGKDMNIDGLTRWLFNLPQVDTLLRTFFYTPQHLLGICFLLLFLPGLRQKDGNPVFCSLAISLSFLSSFFIGGILFVAWAVFFLGRNAAALLRRRFSPRSFLASVVSWFLLPVCSLGLALGLGMFSPSQSGISWQLLSLKGFALTFGLNFGLLLITGIWGLTKLGKEKGTFWTLLLLLSALSIAFIRIQGFESDISLKAGLIVAVLLVLGTAVFFRESLGKGAKPVVLAVLLIAGLPTAILDLRNSSDISNRRFTTSIPAEEMNLLRWMKKNIPHDAVVQDYPPAREWNFSIIPSFAGRSMFVGDRLHGEIFQVGQDSYEKRTNALTEAIRRLPHDDSGLKSLGVDFLFWGEPERRFFGFSPGLEVVKSSGQAVLYRVR